jgi:glycosyltransferase involved in cell wall biosynthesis
VLFLGQVSERKKAELLRTALVCPLPYDPTDILVGGARLKALELLSYGKVIVSTPTGVQGVQGIISGKNMIISQNMDDLARCIINVLMNPGKYKIIAENAALLSERLSWEKVLPEYTNIVQTILFGVV